MEIKAELNKPYTSEQRINFIVEQNHRNGYTIEEQPTKLVALGYTEEEKEAQRREAIMKLSLTAADVERAIYKDKGIDFDDILKLVEEQGVGIDIKGLRIEFKANNFYRGNQYVIAIGSLLGYSEEDLDYLFEHKELPTKEVIDEIEDVVEEEVEDVTSEEL